MEEYGHRIEDISDIASASPKNKFRNFLMRLEETLLKEIKEEDVINFWEKIKNNFQSSGFLNEKVKFSAAGLFLIASCWWIGQSGIIPVAHSEEDSEIANAQAKEKIVFSEPILKDEFKGDEVKKIDIMAVTDYNLKSPEKQCKEDKDERKSSSLCGKDDEEEIKRQDAERVKEMAKLKPRRAIARGPMPYVFKKDALGRLVCNKKSDKPHKSDKKDHKPGHMDMECCLDPDETPNPNCYYGEKYAKYLK